ncbi:MAG: DNA polymerase IV, partial [Synergistaceae bacterium]|nr:DNA polymerase IV [Synergistaceae bacterium]
EVTFQKDTSNFMFLKDVLMVLAVSLESRLQRLGFYARTVTLKLTFYNMKSITRSVSSESGEATDRAYEIFMKAFEQLRLQVRGGLIAPVRLIGISLQNISVSGARQLTFDDVYNHREEFLADRWERAIRGLERKYGVKITLESRDRLYDIIIHMEQRKI